jgi:signal transduction histidine kinase
MSKSKLIILAWLLLLIPTLLLGVGALRLLRSEEARLASSGRAAARDRVGAIAGNIDLAIGEVQDGLLETLRTLPQDDLAGRLEAWKRENPLVRNVFVWQQGRGLRFPDPERPASDEEMAFVRRYLPLFATQSDWQEPPRDAATAAPAGPAAEVSSILAERRELRQLAKQAPAASAPLADRAAEATAPFAGAPAPAPPGQAGRPPSGRSAWRSWYADDQLHLLGWFAPAGSDLRYGVEVEMMALLSRLLGNLPAPAGSGESFALLDGNGAIFHQNGPFEVQPDFRPLAAVSIASLPHWQVAAYADPAATGSSGGVVLIGTLLVGTFIVAILLGGSLLLWQAWRHQREARQKTSFVSSVSHELKTPLTTIRMYAELLGEGTIREPDKQKRYLETIIRESQRLTRLVNNVLDFARLEQGRRSYRHEPLELSGFLQQLFERQAPRLAEAGLQLEQSSAADDLEIRTDRDALEQILLNLLDNAIKYAATGKRLQLDLASDARWIRLRLRDFGPGIPVAHRERIFEKFHRVDASLTAGQQGSGLGLSIAGQLAAGLGGGLRYLPAEGGGSCFELTLPREEK